MLDSSFIFIVVVIIFTSGTKNIRTLRDDILNMLKIISGVSNSLSFFEQFFLQSRTIMLRINASILFSLSLPFFFCSLSCSGYLLFSLLSFSFSFLFCKSLSFYFFVSSCIVDFSCVIMDGFLFWLGDFRMSHSFQVNIHP